MRPPSTLSAFFATLSALVNSPVFVWSNLPLIALTGLLFAVCAFSLGEPLLLLLALVYGAGAVLALVFIPAPPVLANRLATGSAGLAHSAQSSAQLQEELDIQERVAIDGLVRSADAINEVVERQAANAQEQAQVLALTNDLMDEMLQMSERVTQQARKVTQTAQQSVETSRSGQDAIEQSLVSMETIRAQVQEIGTTIATLANLTKRIDDIITSVSDIATQSNLLSLNAAIEAARAGVHGRGFAVVADEVRSLAQQSTRSAGQVRAILSEIQQAMRETIRTTQSGLESVSQGIARTREAETVLRSLSESVQAARSSVAEISKVLQGQKDRVEEVAIGIDRVGRISEQHLISARSFETIAASLTRLASDLQSLNAPERDVAFSATSASVGEAT
jgi:methyl-accepting chemotaxis protein